MPISGLVIRFEPRASAPTLEALRSLPEVELGEVGVDLATAVTETRDAPSEALLYTRIEDIPGVLSVQVAYHDFSDVDEVQTLPSRRRRRERDATA